MEHTAALLANVISGILCSGLTDTWTTTKQWSLRGAQWDATVIIIITIRTDWMRETLNITRVRTGREKTENRRFLVTHNFFFPRTDFLTTASTGPDRRKFARLCFNGKKIKNARHPRGRYVYDFVINRLRDLLRFKTMCSEWVFGSSNSAGYFEG